MPWGKATFCDFGDVEGQCVFFYITVILASQHNMVVLKKIFACVCLFLDSENGSQKYVKR